MFKFLVKSGQIYKESDETAKKKKHTITHLFHIQLFLYHCRIARCQRIIRNVARDHTAGSDDAAMADGHTRADDDSTAQPTVVADGDGISRLLVLTAKHIVLRMLGRVELAVGTDERVASDAYHATIEKRAVVVDEGTLSHHDAIAVVAMKGRTQRGAFRKTGDESSMTSR